MKKTLILKTKNNNIVFKGRPITLPIKETAIKSVCIELFDDADPCIIHESYASQTIIDRFLESFDGPIKDVSLAHVKDLETWLDLLDPKDLYLTIEGKS